jgi:hypothetical protein
MSPSPKDRSAWIEEQMRSIPLHTGGVIVKQTDSGGLELTISLVHRGLARRLRPLLRLSDTRRIELDPLGAHLYGLCDGVRTVEQIVERYQREWSLTFFEARALVLSYLRLLSKRNLILFLKPAPPARHP